MKQSSSRTLRLFDPGVARRTFVRALCGSVLGVLASGALAAPEADRAVVAAINNPARPAIDRQADAARKPKELLSFSGVRPGDDVLELVPGSGYFTRLLSLVVGAKGHVYALVSQEEIKGSAKAGDPIRAIAAQAAFPNVSVITQPISTFKTPGPVDLVWTSQNYHDLHDRAFGPADIPAFNRSVSAALKPGGVFLVVDHAAAKGHGVQDTQTLHRIEPAAARAEIERSGLKLVATSDVLANPDDDHSLRIFDPKIRGKTDKFVFKFQKKG